MLLAASRADTRARRRLRPHRPRARPPRGVSSRPPGETPATDSRAGGSPVQREDAPPPLGAVRRELGLARPPRRRYGADGGPADLHRAPPTSQPAATSQLASRAAPRSAPE